MINKFTEHHVMLIHHIHTINDSAVFFVINTTSRYARTINKPQILYAN